MNRNSRQMVCTLLAVTAPLAHCAGVGYVAVLLAAGAMLPLTVVSRDGLKRISKPEALVELVWLGLVLGSSGELATHSFSGIQKSYAGIRS